MFVGTHDLGVGGAAYKIGRIENHPHYSSNSLVNDIALVKVSGIMVFNASVRSVVLDPRDIRENEALTFSKSLFTPLDELS